MESTSVMATMLLSIVNFFKSIGTGIMQSWSMYTPYKRRNTATYTIGIMLYKIGYESFQGSITSLATTKYNFEPQGRITFQRTGLQPTSSFPSTARLTWCMEWLNSFAE